ncbi:hypothetical protein ACFLYS_02320 [Chloroflexota bacterium]
MTAQPLIWLEQVFLVFIRDAGTVILDFNNYLLFLSRCRQPDLPPGRSILYCIIQQIINYLLDSESVGQCDRELIRQLQQER